LWGVAQWFHWRRGHAGLGGGDVKFAGAVGFWLGWQGLPIMLFIASLTALIPALFIAYASGKICLRQKIAFGPFLCLGALLSWLLLSAGMGR